MCKSINKGVREALRKDFIVAMIIDTSKFQYPNQPYMVMICGDQVIGELVNDKEEIEELRKNRMNLFLWENFVIYTKKIPRNKEKRSEMRVVYLPREPPQLIELPYIHNCEFGTLSTESDTYIKQILAMHSKEVVVGTCVVGYNLKS